MSGPVLCRHPASARWVGIGGKPICGICHPRPKGVEGWPPRIRDYERADVLAAIAEARGHVRAAIRSRQGDGRRLAQLLAPIAEFKGSVDRGHLGVAESRGRVAVEALRGAVEDASAEVAGRLAKAADTIQGVVG